MGTITPRRLMTPLMEIRRVGDRGRVLVAADFLHFQDLDAVALGPEAKRQELAGRLPGGGLWGP
jgi:hypothetical protein